MSERWLRCLKGFVSTTLSTDTPRSVGETTRWRRNLSEGGGGRRGEGERGRRGGEGKERGERREGKEREEGEGGGERGGERRGEWRREKAEIGEA